MIPEEDKRAMRQVNRRGLSSAPGAGSETGSLEIWHVRLCPPFPHAKYGDRLKWGLDGQYRGELVLFSLTF